MVVIKEGAVRIRGRSETKLIKVKSTLNFAIHVMALKTISSAREVVYSDGSHPHLQYTYWQRKLLEKLKIVL